MRPGKRLHPIQIIGVGLKGPEGLCPEVLDRIQQADLLVGGRKILQGFRGFPGQRFSLDGHLKGLDSKIHHAVKLGKRVVVLTSGDPNFFGIARFLFKSFRPEELEIHPHVSSMQLAFARVRIPWDDTAFASAHGRDLLSVIHTVRSRTKVAVLTDPKNHPSRIARALLKAGLPDTTVYVCSRLGGPDEKVWQGNLSSLTGKRFPDLNVMIILNDRAGEEGFGIPDHVLAHDKGMITRSEVRAVTLGKLRIGPGHILWDVGAGSGSVSIEAARLARGVTVYAVEKSAKRISMLKRNILRFGSGNIRVVRGEAPSVLKGLADPDRVFIGGSGGHLEEILRNAVRRLCPGGRIVVNAVTLETLHQTVAFLKKRGLSLDVVSVQIGRGHDLKGKVMMQAENPVFIISADGS